MDVVAAATNLTDEVSEWGHLLELLDRTRPTWQRDAACREAPAGVTFFPARGQDSRPAKRICAGCLVKDECRAWALRYDDLEGVWGGLSRQERRALRPARAA